MSFEQLKEGMATLGVDAPSNHLSPGYQLLFDAVQQSSSETQLVEKIESIFSKLAAEEQEELVKAAFADQSPIIEPLRKLADRLNSSISRTDVRKSGTYRAAGPLLHDPASSETGKTNGVHTAVADQAEDLMTEVWRMIAETRHLFGAPADGWKVPDVEEYLDLFPRENEHWAVGHPERKKLAVLVDGTPCDVVTAGQMRITRARKLIDEVRRLTSADRVTVRPEYLNICGAFPKWGEGTARECSVAWTEKVLKDEQRRLDALLAQASDLFHKAKMEFDKQHGKRIPFFRDYRRARLLAERAVERGEWTARPLLEWMRSNC
jgi:hypothetical protein